MRNKKLLCLTLALVMLLALCPMGALAANAAGTGGTATHGITISNVKLTKTDDLNQPAVTANWSSTSYLVGYCCVLSVCDSNGNVAACVSSYMYGDKGSVTFKLSEGDPRFNSLPAGSYTGKISVFDDNGSAVAAAAPDAVGFSIVIGAASSAALSCTVDRYKSSADMDFSKSSYQPDTDYNNGLYIGADYYCGTDTYSKGSVAAAYKASNGDLVFKATIPTRDVVCAADKPITVYKYGLESSTNTLLRTQVGSITSAVINERYAKVSSCAELANAISSGKTEIDVAGPVSLTGSLTIPKGTGVEIISGGSIAIGSRGVLTVNGWLDANEANDITGTGKINGSGELSITGTFIFTGSVDVPFVRMVPVKKSTAPVSLGGSVTTSRFSYDASNGDLTVNQGAALNVKNDSGKVQEDGSTLYGANCDIGNNLIVNGTMNVASPYTVDAAGARHVNADGFSVYGDVTVGSTGTLTADFLTLYPKSDDTIPKLSGSFSGKATFKILRDWSNSKITYYTGQSSLPAMDTVIGANSILDVCATQAAAEAKYKEQIKSGNWNVQTLTNSGGAPGASGLTLNGDLYVYGTLTVEEDASINLNGHRIIVCTGGSYTGAHAAYVTSQDELITANSDVNCSEIIVNGAFSLTQNVTVTKPLTIQENAGLGVESNASVVFNGPVTVNGSFSVDSGTATANDTFTINGRVVTDILVTDSTQRGSLVLNKGLTINSGAELSNSNDTELRGGTYTNNGTVKGRAVVRNGLFISRSFSVDGSGITGLSTDPQYEDSLTHAAGSYTIALFNCRWDGTNWVYTPVDPEDADLGTLTYTGDKKTTLTDCIPFVVNAGWGETEISFGSYTLPVKIALPDLGFYTSAARSGDTYISFLSLPNTQTRTVYAIAAPDMDVAKLEVGGVSGLTYTVSADRHTAKIVIPKGVALGDHDIIVTATDSSGQSTSMSLHLYTSVPITSMKFTPSSVTRAYFENNVPLNQFYILPMLTVLPENNTDNITLTSSNEAVVTVNASGVATICGAGTARITARSGSGKTATLSVKAGKAADTVNVAKLGDTAVENSFGTFTNYSATLSVGRSLSLSGKAACADGSAPISTKVLWSVAAAAPLTVKGEGGLADDPAALMSECGVTLSGTGKLVSASGGSPCVLYLQCTAESGTGDAYKLVRVCVVSPISKVVITDTNGSKLSKVSLTHNGADGTRSVVLKADVTPTDNTDTLTWSITRGEGIVSIKDNPDGTCTVSAVGPGSATVTAASGSRKRASCSVTVGSAADQLTVTGSRYITGADYKWAASVNVGKTLSLKAVPSYSGGGRVVSTAVNWVSSDDSIATVDARGKVTGVSAGTCTVTASAAYGTAGCPSATFTITVCPVLTSVSLDEKSVTVPAGETYDASQLVSLVWADGGEYDGYANISYACASNAYGVSVDADSGLVSVASGAAVGKTARVTVTVTAGSAKKTAYLTVVVGEPLPELPVTLDFYKGSKDGGYDSAKDAFHVYAKDESGNEIAGGVYVSTRVNIDIDQHPGKYIDCPMSGGVVTSLGVYAEPDNVAYLLSVQYSTLKDGTKQLYGELLLAADGTGVYVPVASVDGNSVPENDLYKYGYGNGNSTNCWYTYIINNSGKYELRAIENSQISSQLGNFTGVTDQSGKYLYNTNRSRDPFVEKYENLGPEIAGWKGDAATRILVQGGEEVGGRFTPVSISDAPQYASGPAGFAYLEMTSPTTGGYIAYAIVFKYYTNT